MRKCLRCGEEMKEDFTFTGGYGNVIRKKGLTGKAVYPKAAVCPKCGEVCVYVDAEQAGKTDEVRPASPGERNAFSLRGLFACRG